MYSLFYDARKIRIVGGKKMSNISGYNRLSDSIEQHLDNLMEELIKTEQYDIMASCLNQCNGTYSNYEKYNKILNGGIKDDGSSRKVYNEISRRTV